LNKKPAQKLIHFFEFQAANPGADIADFVRWHSPRDWIEEEVVTSDGCKMEGEFMEMDYAIRNPVKDCHQ